MSFENFLRPFLGGALIGLSASLLLLLQGRVFGISGIVSGVLAPKKGDTAWRLAVIAGFVVAGIVFQEIEPSALVGDTSGALLKYVLAGLLVGFGTQLGSGCTSGHGVCGLSRLAPRSLAATLTFMLAGILTVLALRIFEGAP